MLLQPQPQDGGQELPSPSATATTTGGTPAAQPTSAPNATQFVSDTLASLLSAQEAPPSASDVASRIMQVADTNGDGSLSLGEIESALGQSTTSGSDSTSGAASSSSADALTQAFNQIDADGDGKISDQELTTALQAQNAQQGAQGPQGPQGAHHGHHHRHMGGLGGAGGADSTSSTDLADTLMGQLDQNGDGSLSLNEVENVLGVSSTSGAANSLASTFSTLDSNGDGQLSTSEISAGIDAFRAAHHLTGATEAATAATQAATAQAVTA
ncbi:MAG: EF-hand domain-containing protein [Proteobacteria bacterium]|nr:EF-hand domain-containing protein [Pseudomonadota bacterium]